jgi:hypothetical protein
VQVHRAPLDRRLGAGGDRRLEARQFIYHHVGPEQEVAAVPQITLGDVAGRRGGIRLLDEAFDAEGAGFPNTLARFDVSVGGRRVPGLHSQGHDKAFGGGAAGGAAGGQKGIASSMR